MPSNVSGPRQANGEILLFLDSDVIPDDGWLAHLLGTFAKPDIPVVFGQPYVAPTNVYSRAFALGWIYEPRDESGRLVKYHKLFPNNTAFRADVYHQTGFKPIGSRSRGASSQLCDELASRGFSVWQNSNACVDHPAPCGTAPFCRPCPGPWSRFLYASFRATAFRWLGHILGCWGLSPGPQLQKDLSRRTASRHQILGSTGRAEHTHDFLRNLVCGGLYDAY